MDDERSLLNEPQPAAETAAQAFARLDGRIAMMSRAVEHLAAERASIDIPDYNPTLEKMNAYLAGIYKRLKAVEDAPALDMTPEEMGARIAAVAERAREADRASIKRAEQVHGSAAQALHQIVGNARTQEGQRRHLQCGIGGGILAGCLLWSFLPGMVARSMPESWHWPERIARRTVGEPTLWEAGIRLMRADSPEGWRAIADAAEIRRDNREAIAACKQAAARTK